ncbi:MAG: sugar transferase, partial [Myxococcales bacterium]|nr:sugar transferase [Myxococcales bacterium]
AYALALGIREWLFWLNPSWLEGAIPPLAAASHFRVVIPSVLAVWLLAFVSVGTYRDPKTIQRTASAYLRASALATLLITALSFFCQWSAVPRSILILGSLGAVPLLLSVRSGIEWVMQTRDALSPSERKLLVVGNRDGASLMMEHSRARPDLGLEVIGWVETSERPAVPSDGGSDARCTADPNEGSSRAQTLAPQRLGGLSDLAGLLETRVVDVVVFAGDSIEDKTLRGAVQLCRERGTNVCVSLTPLRGSVPRIELELLDDLPILSLSNSPNSPFAEFAKRSLDLVTSAAALALVWPLLLLTALAVKLDSPGPVLFRQQRVGQNGRRFDVLKFRSMVTDAEALRATLEARNEMDGPMFKVQRDPRVTRVGRIIRKFSLDELPQLFNVLKGDMSLVGPRPSLPQEVGELAPWQRRRLSMKPGITCIWQVSGRNSLSFEEWMKLDLEYIDNWSFWLDVKLLARTVPAVLRGTGAS